AGCSVTWRRAVRRVWRELVRPARDPRVSPRVATTVWRLSPELIDALDAQLGPPVDGYVNGTQTWLTDTGPGDVTLEWRLHPVSGYRPPKGIGPYELWDEVTGQLAAGADPSSLPLGA